MKIVSVVGGRPQFIKAAVVSAELRKSHQEILLHTGQHYDYNMSGLFFKELGLPEPDYNLGVTACGRGSTHAQMTGRMMIGVEEILMKEKPDWILVYGDMNSTLAAALAGAKLCIPICHVESGVRTHSMYNPEEINRICADHISKLLLACVESAMKELKREGLSERSVLVGDPMYDAYLKYHSVVKKEDITLNLLNGETKRVPQNFCYLTCHRAENTNTETLTEIFKSMESLEAETVYPAHPRNQKLALKIQEQYGFSKIILAEPVGYFESLCLLQNSQKVVTDSGGLQREAFFAKKKCVTVFDYVIHPETMVGYRNQLAKPKAEDILKKLETPQVIDEEYAPFGSGNAAERIVAALGDKV